MSESQTGAPRGTIGIIELDSSYPKIPGNVSSRETFDFPVEYEVADIQPGWWLADGGPSAETEQEFLRSALALQNRGVSAITTSCGLFAVFQQKAASVLEVPILTSPLQLIPLVSNMMGEGRKVGIVTAAGERLLDRGFLGPCGIDASIPLAIAAVDECPEFLEVIRYQRKTELDSAAFENQLLDRVREMLTRHRDVGVLVLECSDIPPYAERVARETGLPVFDFIAMAELLHRSFAPRSFTADIA